MLGSRLMTETSDCTSDLWWLAALKTLPSLCLLCPHQDKTITKPLLWFLPQIQTTQVPRNLHPGPTPTRNQKPRPGSSPCSLSGCFCPALPKDLTYVSHKSFHILHESWHSRQISGGSSLCFGRVSITATFFLKSKLDKVSLLIWTDVDTKSLQQTSVVPNVWTPPSQVDRHLVVIEMNPQNQLEAPYWSPFSTIYSVVTGGFALVTDSPLDWEFFEGRHLPFLFLIAFSVPST